VLEQGGGGGGRGGHIFIGDVRHLGLLETFHTSVELHRAGGWQPAGELRERCGSGWDKSRSWSSTLSFPGADGAQPSHPSVEIEPKRGWIATN
jgi:hypothetical protein